MAKILLPLIILFFIIVVGGLIGSLILYKRRRQTNTNSTNSNDTNDINLAAGVDSATSATNTMDRLTLSWQSLKDLSEYVMTKFSESDRNEVVQAGETLLKYGMRYVHVVDYVLPKKDYFRKIESENETKLDKTSKLR